MANSMKKIKCFLVMYLICAMQISMLCNDYCSVIVLRYLIQAFLLTILCSSVVRKYLSLNMGKGGGKCSYNCNYLLSAKDVC